MRAACKFNKIICYSFLENFKSLINNFIYDIRL